VAKRTSIEQWTTDTLSDARWLALDGDLGIMYPAHVALAGKEHGLPVDVEFDVCEEDHRLVIDRLVVKRLAGGNVDSTVLQELPLLTLLTSGLAAGVGGLGHSLMRRTKGTFDGVDIQTLDDADRAVVIYKLAYAIGLPPNAEVAKWLGISTVAAAKRIERLRGAGRLNATERGRKGI